MLEKSWQAAVAASEVRGCPARRRASPCMESSSRGVRELLSASGPGGIPPGSQTQHGCWLPSCIDVWLNSAPCSAAPPPLHTQDAKALRSKQQELESALALAQREAATLAAQLKEAKRESADVGALLASAEGRAVAAEQVSWRCGVLAASGRGGHASLAGLHPVLSVHPTIWLVPVHSPLAPAHLLPHCPATRRRPARYGLSSAACRAR